MDIGIDQLKAIHGALGVMLEIDAMDITGEAKTKLFASRLSPEQRAVMGKFSPRLASVLREHSPATPPCGHRRRAGSSSP